MNITPKSATPAELAYPDGAILYHLSEDQYRALRAGGVGRELIEIELVTLASVHLLDSIWVVGPRLGLGQWSGARPVALAVVHEDGQIGYPEEGAQAAAAPAVVEPVEPTHSIVEVVELHQAEEVAEELAEEVAKELGETGEQQSPAAPRSLTPQQWADFVLILDVALANKHTTQEDAAAHRANKIEPVKVELEEIIRSIEDTANASEIERDTLAAAVELKRELGASS